MTKKIAREDSVMGEEEDSDFEQPNVKTTERTLVNGGQAN